MSGFGTFGSTKFGSTKFAPTTFRKFGDDPDQDVTLEEVEARTRQHARVEPTPAQVQRDQESIAEHVSPTTGRFTAPWKQPSGRGWQASKTTRFSGETGRRAGQRRSPRKTQAARETGQRYGYLGGPHGIKGGRPRKPSNGSRP